MKAAAIDLGAGILVCIVACVRHRCSGQVEHPERLRVLPGLGPERVEQSRRRHRTLSAIGLQIEAAALGPRIPQRVALVHIDVEAALQRQVCEGQTGGSCADDGNAAVSLQILAISDRKAPLSERATHRPLAGRAMRSRGPHVAGTAVTINNRALMYKFWLVCGPGYRMPPQRGRCGPIALGLS